MRIIRRFVRSAQRNTLRRKTTIGLAELIKVNGEVKCGGAVVKIRKMHQVVNSVSTKVRKMMKMKGLTEKIKMINKNNKRTSDATVAKR